MPNGGKRKRELSLKIWQKLFSLLLVLTTITFMGCTTKEQKECCLCISFRYHAPCLIDLETGDLIELDLYMPHPTLVAELLEPQQKMETFSFVKLGNVVGTKLTDSKIIEFEVPISDKTTNPALCKDCKSALQEEYKGRYVLADLYNVENKLLFSIIDGMELTMRCYNISANRSEDKTAILVTIQGVLE